MKIKIVLLIVIGLVMPFKSMAQTKAVQIAMFEKKPTDLTPRTNPVLDNRGIVCAIIKFWHSGSDFIIEPNAGQLKIEVFPGETRIWVPSGETKRITIRHKGDIPLRNYQIPIRIESACVYEAEIILTDVKQIISPDKSNRVYFGAGYNIMSLSGPSLTVGANLHHHQIELGAVYGLNKSDDLFFYDTSGSMKESYNYNAIRSSLTYGYEIPISDFFFITPIAGISYLAYLGNEVSSSAKSTDYKNANSLSAIGGVRLSIGLGKQFRLCITPEYHAAVYKDKNCKLFSSNDNNMKNWNTGFNLNIGMLVYF